MRTLHKTEKLVWLDIDSPTEADVASIVEDFGINPFVAREFISPSNRAKVDRYQNYLYLILHFPTFKHGPNDKESQEIDCIIGNNFIITGHYETIPALDAFVDEFASGFELEKETIMTHAGFMFYYVLKRLYVAVAKDLERIEDELGVIEEEIFSGHERQMVEFITLINHQILDAKRALKPHERVLESFESVSAEFFGKDFVHYARSLSGEYNKVWNMIENGKEMLIDLRTTNDSLLTTKSNEIMKTLTMMALATFPLTLIAAIFAMGTKDAPILGHPNDFWIIITIMAIVVISMFSWFKYKKWL